ERRRGWKRKRGGAVEMGAAADDGRIRRTHRRRRIVVVGRLVARRRIGLAEMIDQRRVVVVSPFGIRGSGSFRVPIIKPDVSGAAGLDLRHVYPNERNTEQSIKGIDVEFEGRFVVASHEAQITYVVL